jgi:hypothetical protein
MSLNAQEQLTDRVRTLNWYVLVGAVAASLLAWKLSFSLGVAAGGFLAIGNYLFLHRAIKKIFATGRQLKTMAVVGRSFLRFTATGIIILILLKYRLVGAIGLLAGLSIVVFTLIMTGFLSARKELMKEAL